MGIWWIQCSGEQSQQSFYNDKYKTQRETDTPFWNHSDDPLTTSQVRDIGRVRRPDTGDYDIDPKKLRYQFQYLAMETGFIL